MLSFDLIWESSHKNSLIAFFLAITSTTREERPPLEKSDSISINTEPGKAINLTFLKEGKTPYKEPRLSKSEKELTVTIPNPEEVLEAGPSLQDVPAVDMEQQHDEVQGFQAVRSTRSQSEQPQAGGKESDANFTLNIEIGKSGGKVSCKGFELEVTESSSSTQTVDLEVCYQPLSPSYLDPGDILLSPFILVTNMVEQQTELRLTVPFLSDQPEDVHIMTKWIRFYGSTSKDASPVWRDIRRAEELSAFMVEIGEGYAKLYTQENIMFCIVGSRDEEEDGEQYYHGSGLEYTTYGDYDYNYGESVEQDVDDDGADISEKPSVDDDLEHMNSKERFQAGGLAADKALHTPTPLPALGLPPPLPSSTPPRRPFPSPFQNVPLSEKKEEKGKKTKIKKKKAK